MHRQAATILAAAGESENEPTTYLCGTSFRGM
jgi:hypothetical protein